MRVLFPPIALTVFSSNKLGLSPPAPAPPTPATAPPPPTAPALTDEEIERYSRHLILEDATEALKIILGARPERTLANRLLVYDAMRMTFRERPLRRAAAPPAAARARRPPAPRRAGAPGRAAVLAPARAAEKLAGGWAPFVLDVRLPQEAEICQLPFADALVPHPQRQGRRGRPAPGPTSSSTASRASGPGARADLAGLGFDRLFDMEGGILAWGATDNGTRDDEFDLQPRSELARSGGPTRDDGNETNRYYKIGGEADDHGPFGQRGGFALETATITTSEKLANLMFQLQMTGYMFKSAEYRAVCKSNLQPDFNKALVYSIMKGMGTSNVEANTLLQQSGSAMARAAGGARHRLRVLRELEVRDLPKQLGVDDDGDGGDA
ncbi:hypothetical protein SO694_00006695 [Aureococcus anophagefferens]|uniref:Uncharacterized protein n=1 Tax=Aureococcus anophagefferens TaxID=44056 RepID=A0ABR1GAE7_AURAN